MKETELGTILFRTMALIHSLLRQEKINLESDDRFGDLSVNCSSTNISDDPNVLFFLNAEIRRPPSQDKQALGVELTLSVEDSNWIALGEVGWTGSVVGWDSVFDCRTSTSSLEDLEGQIPNILADLVSEFRKEAPS